MKIRPMLAGRVESLPLRFPLLASPKYDGIRALIVDSYVVSRKLIEIPNRYVRMLFGRRVLEGLDGELIVGSPTAHNVFNTTTSAVMSQDGEPKVAFYVFDHFLSPTTPFQSRILSLERYGDFRIVVVAHTWIYNTEALDEYESVMLKEGYEGVMLRDPNGPYKFGRSTEREGYLLKLKRFVDDEARVVGFEELMHNDNEAITDALGLMKRSRHQENRRPAGTLGKFVCDWKGHELRIGTGRGLTHEMRNEVWRHRKRYLGSMVKFKYQKEGMRDLPRLPIFIGFRDARDL